MRAKSLVNKLSKNGKLLEYDSAISEYMRSGCAEPVTHDDTTDGQVYYMPHRAVYRDDKETSRVRVVFDASSHLQGVPSLNDKLSSGENLIPDLLKILINFRLGAIALIADIEKAFLQIGLNRADRDYHRFLWFNEPIKDNMSSVLELPNFTAFRMTRVTFGVTTSPFLLAVVIKKHLTNSPEKEIAQKLLKSFYVDDLILAVESPAEGIQLYEKAKNILSEANMNLRKWCSNDTSLLKIFNSEETKLSNTTSDVKKVLGIVWFPFTDELAIDFSNIFSNHEAVSTKRSLLKILASIFDPMGILGPYTVKAKILLQNIWKRKLDWDENLPEDLNKEWERWRRELLLLKGFSIKRCLIEEYSSEVEVHVFADASPNAFGCVAYLKNLTTGDCDFIVSKNRVSPLNKNKEKTLTLPKLELTAALCAARLKHYLVENLSLKVKDVTLWSDSKISLYWIKGKQKWKPYIQNRVAEILKLTRKESWRYCPGKENPADFVTRGVSSVKIMTESTIWLKGPPWLCLNRDNWPTNDFTEGTDIDILSCFTGVQETHKVKINYIFSLDRFSNLDKVFRVTAYVQRFLNILRKKGKFTGQLRASEINEAEIYWLRVVQNEAFSNEISNLSKEKPLSSQSSILTLKPFLDERNVLRLGGRLQEACLSEEEKHPVILPNKSPFTTKLIWKAHTETLHTGVNSTLAAIRKRFWVIKSRQKIKSTIGTCIKCKRLKGKPGSQPFAPLPRDRVALSHPFEVTGIDFAGPLYVISNEEKIKAYIMLFTCAAVRAVHLELVPDLTSESCLRGLRRFIARRGVPKVIYSDNAKTFKRASDEINCLNKILQDSKSQELAQHHRIEWKFIVERAAWWGGFWERLVRTVKNSLKVALGRKNVNFDELQTVLTEVEMTVNSRPLTYIDEDPNNFNILSPARFLVGSKVLNFNVDFKLRKGERNEIIKSWKLREVIVSKFWEIWSRDYLQQLRSAHFSKNPRSSRFKVGDVVVLHDQQRPRLMWKLARVTSCFKGKDELVRACEIRTSDGTRLRRPVQLLYPLELEHFSPGEDVENPGTT